MCCNKPADLDKSLNADRVASSSKSVFGLLKTRGFFNCGERIGVLFGVVCKDLAAPSVPNFIGVLGRRAPWLGEPCFGRLLAFAGYPFVFSASSSFASCSFTGVEPPVHMSLGEKNFYASL